LIIPGYVELRVRKPLLYPDELQYRLAPIIAEEAILDGEG
jgi:hypothetical protein